MNFIIVKYRLYLKYSETCWNHPLNILTCQNQTLNKLTCLYLTLNKLTPCLNLILNKLTTCLNHTLNKLICLNHTLNKLTPCLYQKFLKSFHINLNVYEAELTKHRSIPNYNQQRFSINMFHYTCKRTIFTTPKMIRKKQITPENVFITETNTWNKSSVKST